MERVVGVFLLRYSLLPGYISREAILFVLLDRGSRVVLPYRCVVFLYPFFGLIFSVRLFLQLLVSCLLFARLLALGLLPV